MELLDFEEYEKYTKELEREKKREEIHKENAIRNRKKSKWTNYKIRMFGRRPIG